ncbi:MAG: response regulator, partial [Sulfuricurvum sp.]|nr:response regulator [Sulfuricurvum sp.]
MGKLRLLIVDDYETNRALLQAICHKMEGFEIREAQDGIEAIDIVEDWHPHIILMDIMMPRLDGFEASKIIKKRYPEIIIMIVTAAIDTKMEENFASLGVAAYIHKPIDKDLIRFKLQSFGELLHLREGKFKRLSHKDALNPFCSDVRHFKTIFDIIDSEAMMDFGMWILMRCENHRVSSLNVDTAIELFYELMRHGVSNEQPLSIIVEENFEEIFVTMKFETPIDVQPKASILIKELGSKCIAQDNIACVRLGMDRESSAMIKLKASKPSEKMAPVIETKAAVKVAVVSDPVVQKEITVAKETRLLQSNEEQMLRQSFVQKTTSSEYISDIGGDVLDEIRDLASLDEEWRDKLSTLEEEPSAQNLKNFVDGVLGVYVGAINNLFEFTALAYALSSLGSFLKENADTVVSDPAKLKLLVMLMEHLGADLASWREHIFGLQDAGDIHYLDSSFFSSCMQIEGIIGD